MAYIPTIASPKPISYETISVSHISLLPDSWLKISLYPADKISGLVGLGWVVCEPVAGEQYAISSGGQDPGVHAIAIIVPKSNMALLIFIFSDNGIQLYPQLIGYYLRDAGRDIVTIETGKAPRWTARY